MQKSTYWKYFLILTSLTFLVNEVCYAQQPGPATTSGDQRGSGSRNSNQRAVAPDTSDIFTFYVNNPNEETLFIDSTLTSFQQYDPTRQQANDYAALGIVGSAHQPLVYTPSYKNGFDLGFHQFDLYYTKGESLPFYRLTRPYTNLWFIQGSEQADNIIKAQFSRDFADGINFTIDYQAISQTGEADQYPNQNNQTRAIATGLWFHSQNNRYDGFLTYTANTTNHQDNGGLITLPATGGEFKTPASAEVYLTDALTRHALREVMYTQYYRFGGTTDSLGTNKRAFTLSHQFTYDKNSVLFSDTYAINDTSFYKWFPALELDNRGARHAYRQKSISNSFRLATFKLADQNKTRQQRDLLEVGITHQYHQVHQEPLDTTINNLLLTGKIGLRPNAKMRFVADASLALFDQAGDYRITGVLDIGLGKAGNWSFKLNNQLYTPSLIQNRFFQTQQVLWDQEFNKTLETNLDAIYSLPAIHLSLGGHYHLLNNYIYFGTDALPKQLNSGVSIFQLSLQKDFSFGAFHLANKLVFQTATEDIVRLPNISGHHSFYFKGRWFKVLDVQCGLDLRYLTKYSPYYYNPMTAQFQLQEDQEVDIYPNLDVYFSMRVSRFRAFFKWENLTTVFNADERFYTTAFYPNPAGALRIGINWRMLD